MRLESAELLHGLKLYSSMLSHLEIIAKNARKKAEEDRLKARDNIISQDDYLKKELEASLKSSWKQIGISGSAAEVNVEGSSQWNDMVNKLEAEYNGLLDGIKRGGVEKVSREFGGKNHYEDRDSERC